jgi:hypothetical protein
MIYLALRHGESSEIVMDFSWNLLPFPLAICAFVVLWLVLRTKKQPENAWDQGILAGQV